MGSEMCIRDSVDAGDMLFNLMGLVVGFFIALLVRYAWAKVSE